MKQVFFGGEQYAKKKWNISSINKEFKLVRTRIHDLNIITPASTPPKGYAAGEFINNAKYSIELIFQEKEIILFALLQIAAIAMGYYLWIQMLGWIPSEVYESARKSDGASPADIILLLWGFVCVGLAAYPISIFTACIGASHFITINGGNSTIASCLRLVLPKSWPLWVFIWADSWISVMRFIERLPRKNDRRSAAQKILQEVMYQAWKTGTIGVLPSLITGRGLVESCRSSVGVVKNKFAEIIKLRVGYSVLCWIVGIAGYIGTIVFFIRFPEISAKVFGGDDMSATIYLFYTYAGIPLLVGIALQQLFLRPIYIISSCKIYSDYLIDKQERIMLPEKPSKALRVFVAFLILLIFAGIVFLYRDQLGLTHLLSIVRS